MSAQSASTAPASSAERREQPFLYTWNRRLRHLHGVSLRNLNLKPPVARTRGKTIADDDYDYEITSPSKYRLRNEAKGLHHARSYDQLTRANGLTQHTSPTKSRTEVVRDHGENGSPKRPVRHALRRRSTLHWATSDPRSRQSKLEAVEVDRLVTSWFSIHHEATDEPVYISEVMENSMNPSFNHFDLDRAQPLVSRSSSFSIQIWAKAETNLAFQLLLAMKLDMRSLQYIGKSLEHFHHPLPENCVLFHLSDGMYTSFTDLPADHVQQPRPSAAAKQLAHVHEAPFETLLKLANVEEVVQDAISTRSSLEADINHLLTTAASHEQMASQLTSCKDAVRGARVARDAERRSVQQLERTKNDRQKALEARRHVLKGSQAQSDKDRRAAKQIQDLRQSVQQEMRKLDDTWLGQTRRVCATLLQVFPIEPLKSKPLHFTIRNIYLPNSSFSDTNRDEIGAALEYVAQLVFRLSVYLSIPLPYPIEIQKPFAYITDEISAGIAQRQFQLFPSGAPYKFEYGVFLLNKNIEFMLNRNGLRIMDIRHTLPNLKYLLFVLTAGSGELPDRKAGGIPALLRARGHPGTSRRNSEDSLASQNTALGVEETGSSDKRLVSPPKLAEDSSYGNLRNKAFRQTAG